MVLVLEGPDGKSVRVRLEVCWRFLLGSEALGDRVEGMGVSVCGLVVYGWGGWILGQLRGCFMNGGLSFSVYESE